MNAPTNRLFLALLASIAAALSMLACDPPRNSYRGPAPETPMQGSPNPVPGTPLIEDAGSKPLVENGAGSAPADGGASRVK